MERGYRGNEGADEREVPVAGIVQRVWSRLGGWVTSDLRDDCEVEARLTLWRCRETLARLPAGERAAYGRRVAWNAALRVLKAEIKMVYGTIAWETLGEDAPAGGRVDEWSLEWEAPRSDPLLKQLGRPEMAAAVGALRTADRELLDMICVEAMTSSAIAQRLQTTPRR
jgi:DNA-directed RNA polymerase specialized sigma24 family protein